MLRVDGDADGAHGLPEDSPFTDAARERPTSLFGIAEERLAEIRTEALPGIWPCGVRNPCEFASDPETGDLFVADMGQNLQEEIIFRPASSQGGAVIAHRQPGHDLERVGAAGSERSLTLSLSEVSMTPLGVPAALEAALEIESLVPGCTGSGWIDATIVGGNAMIGSSVGGSSAAGALGAVRGALARRRRGARHRGRVGHRGGGGDPSRCERWPPAVRRPRLGGAGARGRRPLGADREGPGRSRLRHGGGHTVRGAPTDLGRLLGAP